MSGAFTVAVQGATLSGEAEGEGTPLILLHGMAGERGDWNRLLATLPAGLPTLRYDLRGFGASMADEDVEYSHAEDLLALLDARGIARAPVLGLSMGGGAALNFALSHPRRVSQLILISPALVGWEWSAQWKALWRGVTDAARSGDMAQARENWWRHPMFAQVRESAAGPDLRHAIEAYHGRHWIRDRQRRELPDIDRLHTLAMPTLLLTGEHDVADIRLIAQMIEAAAPEVRHVDYAGAGHMLHLERTAEVAAQVARFLA